MINNATKEKIKKTRLEINKLNSLNIEGIVNELKNKKIMEFTELDLPFYGKIKLAVSYGYYNSSSGGFTPDPELRFLHSEDAFEKPKKKYPHDVMGGFGDAYAVSLITEDMKPFRQYSTSSLFGDPLNDVGGIRGLVKSTIEYWVKHESINDMLPAEIFECPFNDGDKGIYKIEVRDYYKEGGEVAGATTFKEAKEKKAVLEDRLYDKERGNVNMYCTISHEDVCWVIPPIGKNYVEVI